MEPLQKKIRQGGTSVCHSFLQLQRSGSLDVVQVRRLHLVRDPPEWHSTQVDDLDGGGLDDWNKTVRNSASGGKEIALKLRTRTYSQSQSTIPTPHPYHRVCGSP